MSSTDATYMPINVGDLVRALPMYSEHQHGWLTVVGFVRGAMRLDAELDVRLAPGFTWRSNAVEVRDRTEREERA